MTQPRRDNAASVKQRLLNVAHVLDEEFEQVLVRYVAERFLFRLSKSYHADSFLLKGAMLFVAWEGLPHRVTRDVDLLGLGEPSVDRVAGMMRDIALQPVEDDGISFDIASVEAEAIRTAQDYGGVRVTVNAMLGKARIRLQVDVGFGDAVTPEAQIVEFPSLLGHMPAMLLPPPLTVDAYPSLQGMSRDSARNLPLICPSRRSGVDFALGYGQGRNRIRSRMSSPRLRHFLAPSSRLLLDESGGSVHGRRVGRGASRIVALHAGLGQRPHSTRPGAYASGGVCALAGQ